MANQSVQSFLPSSRQCYWANLHHLANTIELVLPLAHLSPQPKREIDLFSRFCTAHGRESLCFAVGAPFPKNCPFPTGSGFVMIPWAHPIPQSKRCLDWLSCFCIDDHSVPILYNGTPLPPSKLPLPMGDLDPI